MAIGSGTDRALASGVIIFVAMLVVAALVFIILNSAMTDIDTAASGFTTDTDAQDHIDLLVDQIWVGILVFASFLGGMFLIARAVLESRRPG